MQLRQARKQDHNEMAIVVVLIHLAFTHAAPPKHIHLRGSYTIHTCNANGVRESFGKGFGLQKEARNVKS